MTVIELIKVLKTYPEDMKINCRGSRTGTIRRGISVKTLEKRTAPDVVLIEGIHGTGTSIEGKKYKDWVLENK